MTTWRVLTYHCTTPIHTQQPDLPRTQITCHSDKIFLAQIYNKILDQFYTKNHDLNVAKPD